MAALSSKTSKVFLGLTLALGFAVGCGSEAEIEGYDCPTTDQLAEGTSLTCGGEIVVGTQVASSATTCASGGEECLLAAGQIAAPAEELIADVIREGTTIAGITGTLPTEALALCDVEGQTNCTMRSPFIAADSTDLASQLVAGNTIGDVSGEAVVTAADDCSSIAEVGCLTTNEYKAIPATGLAQCLINNPDLSLSQGLVGQERFAVLAASTHSPVTCAEQGLTALNQRQAMIAFALGEFIELLGHQSYGSYLWTTTVASEEYGLAIRPSTGEVRRFHRDVQLANLCGIN